VGAEFCYLLGIIRQNRIRGIYVFPRIKPSFLFFIVAALLLGAYVANPTEEDFKYHVFTGAKQEMKVSQGDVLSDLVLNFIIDKGSKYFVHRKDYKLFSLYYVDFPGQKGEIRYLGAFGKFMKLK